ncbi:MAG: hypothetical protein AAB380_01615 [Verrucomicrobiota bacterium]
MNKVEIRDPEYLRQRWFDQPLCVIEHGGQIPAGNGAVIALMAVFPLYERFLDSVRAAQPNGTDHWKCLADDTGLNDSLKAAMFWNVFRDGLLHRGMFFEDSKKAREPQKQWGLPKVSLHIKHPPLPTYGITNKGEQVICLNPWGFVQHVLNKYRADPELLTRDTDSPLLLLSLVVREEVKLPN